MRNLPVSRSRVFAGGIAAAAVSAILVAVPRAAVTTGNPQAGATPARTPAGVPSVSFDLVLVDREGRVPESLGTADLTVTVEGRVRRVMSIRRVSRGPGALNDASSRQARSGAPGYFAAEPARNVIVVVDEGGVVLGEERAAGAAVRALLDRLGVADRTAVLRLPLAAGQLLSLSTDQPSAREALAGIVGRVLPSLPARPEEIPVMPARPPDAEPGSERPPEPVPASQTPPQGAVDLASASGHANLEGLASILEGLAAVPGRKRIWRHRRAGRPPRLAGIRNALSGGPSGSLPRASSWSSRATRRMRTGACARCASSRPAGRGPRARPRGSY
jgi:hypothetical protein